MIILPTEKRFDWKYAPVMLFSIVLINVLIFFFYQSNDEQKFERAFLHYAESGLLANEWQAYQSYLAQQNEHELLEAFQAAYKEREIDGIIVSIMVDDDFYRFVETNSNQLTFDAYNISDSWENWLRHRKVVNSSVQSTSALQYGLIPEKLHPMTLLTHQFLHGNLMHLLGNMFFLVFCGFAVEAAIGSWLFLGLYLASGVVGGLFFAFTDLQNANTLVGASGAISGVMAIYLGIFRLRIIEFFYWIFIFVGYFRAPAMLILPFYIGKELIDFYYNTDSNVAFMAHTGGFIGGSVLLACTYFFKPTMINHEYVEENQDADPRREALARIYSMIDKVYFATALKEISRFTKQYGDDFELAALRYQLSRAIEDDHYLESFNKLIAIKPENDQELDQLAKAWKENEVLLDKLDFSQTIKLALTLTTTKHISLAEQIFIHFYHPDAPKASLDILARKLSVTFGNLKSMDKKQHYETIADQFITGAY